MTGPQFVRRPDAAPLPVSHEPLRVGEYLDRDLKAYARMRDLQDLADQAATAPLDVVLRDLRAVLGERRLTGADSQRLHVLLSQLYHAHPALDGPQLDQLRSEVNTAWELSRSGAFLRETREE